MAMMATITIFKTADFVTEYSPSLIGIMTTSVPHLEAAISDRYIYIYIYRSEVLF
jgi:hypothetical protein